MGDPRGSMGRPIPAPGHEHCSVSQEMALVMGTMWRGPLQSCFCLPSWEDEQLPPPLSLSLLNRVLADRSSLKQGPA